MTKKNDVFVASRQHCKKYDIKFFNDRKVLFM